MHAYLFCIIDVLCRYGGRREWWQAGAQFLFVPSNCKCRTCLEEMATNEIFIVWHTLIEIFIGHLNALSAQLT